MLTTTQAAQILGVTRERVVMLIRSGNIEAQKLGRDYVIEEKTLAEYERPKRGRPPKQK